MCGLLGTNRCCPETPVQGVVEAFSRLSSSVVNPFVDRQKHLIARRVIGRHLTHPKCHVTPNDGNRGNILIATTEYSCAKYPETKGVEYQPSYGPAPKSVIGALPDTSTRLSRRFFPFCALTCIGDLKMGISPRGRI